MTRIVEVNGYETQTWYASKHSWSTILDIHLCIAATSPCTNADHNLLAMYTHSSILLLNTTIAISWLSNCSPSSPVVLPASNLGHVLVCSSSLVASLTRHHSARSGAILHALHLKNCWQSLPVTASWDDFSPVEATWPDCSLHHRSVRPRRPLV